MGLVVVIWRSPCFPCSYFSRTYCDLWYRWVYQNGMDNAEWKPNIRNMQEGAYPKNKRKSVDGQFAAVKYRSETYCWTQKLSKTKQGRLRGRQVLCTRRTERFETLHLSHLTSLPIYSRAHFRNTPAQISPTYSSYVLWSVTRSRIPMRSDRK